MCRYCWRTLWFVPFIWKLWKLLTYTYENAHREKITQSLRQCSVSLSLPLFQFFVVIVVGDADDSMGLEWEMLWISKSGTAFFPAAVCRLTKDFLLLPPLKTNMNFETCIPWSFSPRKSISDWRAFTMYQIHEYFLHFAYKWHTIEWMLVWKSVFSTGNRFGSFQRVFTRNCVCAVNFYWYENIIYLKNACVCEASLTFCPRRTLILS